MGFNLSDYETVKQRKKRFYNDYPDGRIIVKNISDKIQDYALIEATIYKCVEEQEKGLPFSTGNALEIREKELKMSRDGKEYESVNYTSWVENCEESAVGRALDNAGYAGNDKCSREEIEKVQRQKDVIENNKSSSEKSKRMILLNQLADIIKSGNFEETEIRKARAETAKAKNNKDLNALLVKYQSELNKRKKESSDIVKGAEKAFDGKEVTDDFKDDDPEDAKDKTLEIF